MEREPHSENRITKTGKFLKGLQRSWKITKKLIKEVIIKQFDKKRQNLQGSKKEDNMWLEAKNIHLN